MFTERKPLHKSRKPKTLVYGIGDNDVAYATSIYTSEGKKAHCPYFQVWKNMLMRCYSNEYQQKQPTYIGCSVAKEWHKFSVFKSWMENQDWENKQLDKDIISLGNKIYGPNTCVFISRELNMLLVLRKNARGPYPLGVSRMPKKRIKQFVAQLRTNSKQKILGYFHTPEEAFEAYKKGKLAYIQELAVKETNPVIKNALLRLK